MFSEFHTGLLTYRSVGFTSDLPKKFTEGTDLSIALCASSLQTAYGGVQGPHELLPVPVSLTRSGYPRIIPSFHRHLIYKKDHRADQLVQLDLSFFSLSKMIQKEGE